jgi:hypothetical protein
MNWCVDLNDEEPKCLVIKFASSRCVVNQCCLTTRILKLVLRRNFPLVMVHVKSNCVNHVKVLVDEQ